MLAQDALADEPGLSRVGTGGEIKQENEVLRRYNANGKKGLRGLVALVLRHPDWQFRDGHPNEERGRKRCYSRVYEILHPARRRTKR